MGELLHGGFAEYGRMLRMLLWSIVPLGIAFAIGGGLSAALDTQTESAILASEVHAPAPSHDRARPCWRCSRT